MEVEEVIKIHEIIDFVKWLVPFIIAYAVWIHKLTIDQDKKILKLETIQAVHTEKFSEITKWLKKISDEIKGLRDEIHSMELKHSEEKNRRK